MSVESPWPRRIVICCDGTWQSSVTTQDNVPSNVTKLCRHIARIGIDDKGKKYHQLVYYDSGIGTGNLGSSERKRQGGTGAGLSENVIEAYNFIVLNYEPGDEIFCFGFSRGAYTARAVAGLVTDIGVIKPKDMQVFPEIYRAYMTNDEGEVFRETKAWKAFVSGKLNKQGEIMAAKGGQWGITEQAKYYEIDPHDTLELSEKSRKVKVVGVWDTVGSLGIPDVAWFNFSSWRSRYGFHNVKLTENIEHAFHALALDERRGPFRPTLWYIPYELKEQLAKDKKQIPELKQVWFPGVHINSGGGNDDTIGEMKGDLEHLSTATFCWMLQCIAPYLTIDQEAFNQTMAGQKRFYEKIRHACTYHHETWGDWVKNKIPKIRVINPGPDVLDPPKRDPPHEHIFDYGWGTGPVVNSRTGIYLAAKSYERVPGHCELEVYDDGESKLVDINSKGFTNEYIHPICHYRDIIRGFEKTAALRKFKREFSNELNRYFWRHTEDKDHPHHKPLPEWIILNDKPGKINYERAWYHQCEQTDEMKKKLKDHNDPSYEKDWLESLDEKVDFSVGDKEAHEYP
ncbi:hypothetical protein CC78DRAFT_37266 [Lojkania enalia]|uniref:T6SS Phospholipase effector Tle1-like catalytic domain-containing protein n=1 Tax=Lojkania enalia TaxID=147567 RepID=A0A9P4MZD6_9PLEO|nr:hypothetical protein CC78DRAFT_37266 [Didymosphaeria enalia]